MDATLWTTLGIDFSFLDEQKRIASIIYFFFLIQTSFDLPQLFRGTNFREHDIFCDIHLRDKLIIIILHIKQMGNVDININRFASA